MVSISIPVFVNASTTHDSRTNSRRKAGKYSVFLGPTCIETLLIVSRSCGMHFVCQKRDRNGSTRCVAPLLGVRSLMRIWAKIILRIIVEDLTHAGFKSMSAYPSHEFQGLTEAGELLLAGGRTDRRLTEDQLLQLRLHIKMIASWADRVPQKTNSFFTSWQPILVLPRMEGYTRDELAIAAYLQPLHSQLGAISLQRAPVWRAFIPIFATKVDQTGTRCKQIAPSSGARSEVNRQFRAYRSLRPALWPRSVLVHRLCPPAGAGRDQWPAVWPAGYGEGL